MEILTGEVIDIKNEFKTYREFKEKFDGSLNMQAEAFVLTGYLIKRARDTDVLKESGYKDYNEFAAAEYGLDKSQVSRYIGINDQFSEGGYSDRLQERYKNFGYTKLAIMLTLPATVNKELTSDYSKQEILTLKAEIDEEKQRTDIEVMLEEKDSRQQAYDLFGKVLYQLGHDDPELYMQIYGAARLKDTDGSYDQMADVLADILAPAGEGIRIVRIAGEGKLSLNIKGCGINPVIINLRTAEKTEGTWDGMIRSVLGLYKAAKDPAENWKILYGEDFPGKKPEVAPVQPERGEKQEQKKPGRVIVSKPQKPKTTGEDKRLANKPAEENVTEPSKTVTEDQKEEETANDENTVVAPVQPDIPAQQAENSEDTAPSGADGDDAGPADDAPAAGTGDGSRSGDAEDDTSLKKEPPAAGMKENAEGQIEIADYTGIAPDNTAANQRQATVGIFLTALRDNLDKVYILTERGEYQNAEKWLEAVKGTIHKIRDISEADNG